MEKPLKWTYSPEKVLHIENTGHSWTVTVAGADSSNFISFLPIGIIAKL
jgi:hypothetical protein